MRSDATVLISVENCPSRSFGFRAATPQSPSRIPERRLSKSERSVYPVPVRSLRRREAARRVVHRDFVPFGGRDPCSDGRGVVVV